jgi:hypothetical protein
LTAHQNRTSFSLRREGNDRAVAFVMPNSRFHVMNIIFLTVIAPSQRSG